MLDLYINIKKRRKELGMSQTELANKTGYTDRSMIAKIENGKVDLSQSKIELFATALSTTAPDLMGYNINKSIINKNMPIAVKPTKNIPVVGTVACGNPIYAEENILEYISVNSDDNVDFALYAEGDSMNNCKIDDGDIIYIRKQNVVDDGDIALVLVDDTATIKRFYDYPDKVILKPDSRNPHHKDLEYNKSEHTIVIQGKVIFIKTFVR